MNQILLTKLRSSRRKTFFKIQLLSSLIIAFIITMYSSNSIVEKNNMEYLSKLINKNLQISSIYGVKRLGIEESMYLGVIEIPRINIKYVVYTNLTDDLLKISPCKFSGVDLGEKGNLCVVGHNYNDNRFFSKLNELRLNDEIIMTDLESREYIYTVFDIYETNENDLSCLENSKEYELTLITCNNSNKKRIIIKALKE